MAALTNSSYRTIFKATSIYGGLQVFNIIIGIVKSKIVSILLGVNGIGMLGLFTTTLEMLKLSTGLGLNQSAVRDVSEAYGTNDALKVQRISVILKNWIRFTSLLGVILTISIAPLLSQWTFGNRDMTWAFICLSIVVFFNTISSGQLALLQGMRKIKLLSKASLLGTLFGLITSIPCFYIYGIKGIVPSLIITAIAVWGVAWYYTRPFMVNLPKITYSEIFSEGLDMVKLGIMMMLGSFIVMVASYIIRTYLNFHGGLEIVGLYQAGFLINEVYFGMIYTAMATDYYPRLSAACQDNKRLSEEVNKQAEMGLLIMLPFIIILFFGMPLVIKILYTSSFLPVVSFVNWLVLSNVFKISSWSIGFLLFAKKKTNVFILTSLSFNAIFLFNNIIGYNLYGLTGIGIASVVNFIIHLIVLQIIGYHFFSFKYKKEYYYIMLMSCILCSIAFVIQGVDNSYLKYISGTVVLLFSIYYSFNQLDKRIDIKSFVMNKLGKRR